MNVFRRCMAAVRSLFTGRVGNAGDAQTAFEEGNICFDRGDVVSAIAKFSDAIRFNPELCDTYYQRGIAYLNTRELDKAIADFTGANEGTR